MSAAEQLLPYYTVDDWQHWEGRWEIINGIPYAMSPMPNKKHQYLANSVGAAFHSALKACEHCYAFQPLDFHIRKDTVLQPDLVVACEDINAPHLEETPVIVVEILSPSTASKDRMLKYNIYEKKQVRYYLIVDPLAETVEVFELDKEQYQLRQKARDFPYRFELEKGCSADIDFGEIWR